MERTGRVVKGVWDCDQCGATKIPREYMNCPNCGAPQGEEVSFYIDNPNNYATDEEAAHSLRKGPHWLCSYCGSWTEGDQEVCRSCGATKEDSDKNYFEVKAKKEARAREKERQRRENEAINRRKNTNDRGNAENNVGDTSNNPRVVNNLGGRRVGEEFGRNLGENIGRSLGGEFGRTVGRELGRTVGKRVDSNNFSSSNINNQTREAEEVRRNRERANRERANTNDRSSSNDEGFGGLLKSKFPIFACILLVFLLIAGVVYSIIPKQQTLKVEGVAWERVITVEKYQTIKDSGWSAPSGARVTDTRKEKSGTKQVQDGTQTITEKVSKQVLDGYDEIKSYKDLGNGDFEEYVDKVPKYKTEYDTVTKTVPKYKTVDVYDTKYYYELDVWRKEKELKTSGTDKNPYWDDTDITLNNEGTSGNPEIGDLKEGDKTESYYITASNKKGKKKQYTMTKSDWDKVEVGKTIEAKVSANGKLELVK